MCVMKSILFRYVIYASILLWTGCASHQDVMRADSRISNIEKSRDQFQMRMEDFRKNQMEKDQDQLSEYKKKVRRNKHKQQNSPKAI